MLFYTETEKSFMHKQERKSKKNMQVKIFIENIVTSSEKHDDYFHKRDFFDTDESDIWCDYEYESLDDEDESSEDEDVESSEDENTEDEDQ